MGGTKLSSNECRRAAAGDEAEMGRAGNARPGLNTVELFRPGEVCNDAVRLVQLPAISPIALRALPLCQGLAI